VKEKQEKDKIRTKPDKNGKRGKAWQWRRLITVKKEEKRRKYKVQGTKDANLECCIQFKIKTRAEFAIYLKMQSQGPNLPFGQSLHIEGVNRMPTLKKDLLEDVKLPRWVEAKVVSSKVESERKPRKGQNRIKTEQNGKRGEAEKSQKQLQSRKQEKLKKIQVKGPEMQRNSYVYDPNPNSFDCPPDSYHPPHPTYETYSYDSYGNDSQFGYDCRPQLPLNYESEPGYNENYNSYPYDSSSLPQQYPCYTRCGGPHETC
nr:hypothetical protein [Tanacetum cinerariifolium]